MINKRLISLLKDLTKYIKYNVILNLISLFMNVIFIGSIAFMLEGLFTKQTEFKDYLITGFIFLIVILIRFICQRNGARMAYLASNGVKKALREKIYKKLLNMGTSYQEKFSTAEMVQVAIEGVDQLEVYFGRYLPQLFYSMIAPICLFLFLSIINLKSAVILLVCVPLIPISIIAVQRFAKKLLSKYWGAYTSLGDSFLENLQGLTTLKIYQADKRKTEEMDREAEHFRKMTMKVLIMQLNSISVMDLIAYGGAAVGIVTALLEFQKGRVSLAGLLMIILLSSEFFIPLRLLGSFFHIAMNGMAASDKIFQVLDMEIKNEANEEIGTSNLSIKINHAGYAYEENRRVLDDIDIIIEENTFVSFVGKSGCGKSTLAGILAGYHQNYSGSIQIGDKELRNIKGESLRNAVTLVNHNGYLFAGTVEYNLRMGKPNATVQELWNVLNQVNLTQFIKESGGLSMELQEQAANLSGGQKQRLALARALLRNTPIYIFDEATSNIDVESENDIMGVIHKLKKTKTILLISHRLENVFPSDRIYMMDEGGIIEEGSHRELYQREGSYWRLCRGQEELLLYTKGLNSYEEAVL